MLRKTPVIVFAAVLVLGMAAVVIAQDEAVPVDDAYKQLIEERREYDDMAKRLELTKAFLDKYPDSKYTARLAHHVYYYQGDQLDDVPGAIVYAEGLRAGLTNPEWVVDFDKKMVELYGEAGMLDKMTKVAGDLETAGEMKFNDYWNIMLVATEYQNWAMVRAYAFKAWPTADADGYRADYPDYDMTDEEIQKAGDNRTGMVAGKEAWALANMGLVDEALTHFEMTSMKLQRSFVGVPDYDIGLHYANTLLMKDDYEGAIKLFAPEALIMQNEKALAGLKDAYTRWNGSNAGFDEYAAKLHVKIAPKIEDFELSGYDGNNFKYADIRGEVTMLAFWFPT